MAMPAQVRIVEVGPRDGLQNEKATIATADKIALVDRLLRRLVLTGLALVLLVPLARANTDALGWLPLWLVGMPAVAWWALHRFRMPGRVVLVHARAGDTVTAGQELLVLEAMKMELALKAPRDGTVAEVRAAVGDFVDADAVLVALEA